MPHPMLHGLRLRSYAPYTRGLQSGPTEWIIWWIAHKRKLANLLSYSKQWISFSYHLLPIIHAYNASTSWLWLHITTLVVDPDSSHTAWLDSDITPWPSCLDSDIASMTRQQHRAMAKSPRQQHHAKTNVGLATLSPAGLDSTVLSRPW
jgi:hypothetical protein